MPELTLLQYDDVRWGIEPCTGHEECTHMADLLYDGQPLCIECADLLLHRQNAIGRLPQLREQLPPLWEGPFIPES